MEEVKNEVDLSEIQKREAINPLLPTVLSQRTQLNGRKFVKFQVKNQFFCLKWI